MARTPEDSSPCARPPRSAPPARGAWPVRLRRRLLPRLLLALAAAACSEARPTPFPARVRVGIGARVPSFDPHATTELVAMSVNSNLYQTLVQVDADLKLLPLLASHWFSTDERTWVFDLVPDVRFHDGSPCTSEDVAFSILRARDDPHSEWSAGLPTIAAVETPSPQRLLVRTHAPDPTLMVSLAAVQVVPRGSGPIASSGLRLRPVGTGPYRFASLSPAGGVELKAWDGYWGKLPDVSLLSFSSLPDERQRVEALLAGRLDLISDVPPELTGSIAGREGLQLLESAGLLEVYLGFDHGRARTPYASPARNPFRDRRVRSAVAAAIDRARLAAEVGGEQADQLVPRGVFGWDPERRPAPTDRALARRLLGAAGYPDGFSVVLDAPLTSFVGDARVAPFVARELAAVSLQVKVRRLPKDPLFRKWRERDTSFFVGGWTCTSGDAQEVLDFLLHTPEAAGGLGAENIGRYSNPAFDRLARRARETMTREQRLRLLHAASREALDDVAWVPLYVAHDRYGVRRGLDWSPRPDRLILGAQMRLATGSGAP
jgi:peptide/nickel transport system substrate-binding protein